MIVKRVGGIGLVSTVRQRRAIGINNDGKTQLNLRPSTNDKIRRCAQQSFFLRAHKMRYAIRISMLTVAVYAIAGGLAQYQASAEETVDFSAAPGGPSGSRPSVFRIKQIEKTGESARATSGDKTYHDSVGSYLPMNVLWRIRTGDGDRTISISSAERDMYPLDGAIFYIPAQDHKSLGTVPLYRLYNGQDHMVSLNPHEGAALGYRVEGILGYPFVAQQPGTTELIRTYNALTGHHSLRNATGLETEEGFVDQRLGVFGYPRYYNQSEQLLSLSGGGVTVESNEAAGGALWHWTWNGFQVINNYDNGRQIQTDIFPPDYANPTEAGDTWSGYKRGALDHGSPVGLAENVGLTQRTRTVALDYDPDGTQQCVFEAPPGPCPGFGGGPDNPVVWPQVMLGKDLTLDFNGLGSVALYSTFMQVPKALPATTAREIPVIYARAAFYRLFLYNAETRNLQEEVCDNNPPTYSPNFGGVIATTGDKNIAIGLYAVNTSHGGSADYLLLNYTWSCPGPPADVDELGADTTIVDAVRNGGYPAGTTQTNVYVVSGTLKMVTDKMDELYRLRDSIPR